MVKYSGNVKLVKYSGNVKLMVKYPGNVKLAASVTASTPLLMPWRDLLQVAFLFLYNWELK